MDEEGGEPRGAIKPQLERACPGVSRLQSTLRRWTVSLGAGSWGSEARKEAMHRGAPGPGLRGLKG